MFHWDSRRSDWIGTELWPAARDKFPVDSLSLALQRDAGGLEGLRVLTVVDFVLPYGVYDEGGCAAGTPLPDCPASSFHTHDQLGGEAFLQVVPESGATMLAAAALLFVLVATDKRRPFQRRRGAGS